ncbi:MAG: hypothetical protein ACREA9_04005 [Pyrinomonadaceae bacterium]
MNHDVYYFCVGFSVFAIFGLKLELLLQEVTFKIMLAIAGAAFVAGVVIHFTDEASHSAAGALFAPLPTLGYFWLLRKLFLKWAHREPIDTAMNWTPGLAKDRALAFAFLFGAMFIIFVTIIGGESLAKVGW